MVTIELRSGRISWLAVVLLGFSSGCAAKDPNIPTLAPVTGVVTYKGAPLADATVTFSCLQQDKGFHAGLGNTNAQGEYSIRTYDLNGAVVGNNGVKIVANDAKTMARDPESGKLLARMAPGWKPPVSRIPVMYGDSQKSKLTAEVEEGVTNVIDFELDDDEQSAER